MTILDTLDRIGKTTQVKTKAITEHSVLNEAYDYEKAQLIFARLAH